MAGGAAPWDRPLRTRTPPRKDAMTTRPATPTTTVPSAAGRPRRTGSLRHPVTARASSDLLARTAR
jgi:hypothetical protein